MPARGRKLRQRQSAVAHPALTPTAATVKLTAPATKRDGPRTRRSAGGKLRVDERADQMRALKIAPTLFPPRKQRVDRAGKDAGDLPATVDDGVPGFSRAAARLGHERIRMLPRATEERTAREATRGKQSAERWRFND